ncbi:MAG: energy transducer TonB [Thermoanaerobaculia bacterium]
MKSLPLLSLLCLVLGSCATSGPCGPPTFVETELGRTVRPEAGSCVTMPEVLHREEAAWPDELRERGIQGTVDLEALIDRNGRVVQARVVKGLHPVLDRNAVAAIRQWRFEPTVVDGLPVPVLAQFTFAFRLV